MGNFWGFAAGVSGVPSVTAVSGAKCVSGATSVSGIMNVAGGPLPRVLGVPRVWWVLDVQWVPWEPKMPQVEGGATGSHETDVSQGTQCPVCAGHRACIECIGCQVCLGCVRDLCIMRSLLHRNGLPQEKPGQNEGGHLTAWRQEFFGAGVPHGRRGFTAMVLQKPVLEKPSTILGELENSGLLYQRAQRS